MANDAFISEEIERVYTLYGAQLRTFGRALYGLLVTGLAVFALIVVPFLGFSIQKADLTLRESALAALKKESEEALTARQAELEAMRDIGEQINEFAYAAREYGGFEERIESAISREAFMVEKRAAFSAHSLESVRNWAAGLRDEPPPEALSSDRKLTLGLKNPCEWRLTGNDKGRADYVACGLCTDFRGQGRRIIQTIRKIPADLLEKSNARKETFTAISERACGWLVGDDIHWHLEKPRPDEPWGLREFFTWDLKEFEDGLKRLRSQIGARVEESSEQIRALEATIDATRAELESASSQLARLAEFDKLGTAVGEVPITLIQVVLLFPVAVAVAFLIIANSLSRLAALRRTLAGLFARRDNEGDLIDSAHISVIAPLWLDHQEGPLVQVMKWVVLLIPLGLIFTNLYLIDTAQILDGKYPEGAAITSTAYRLLYVASLALTVGALVYIWRVVSRAQTDGSAADD